MIDLEAIAEDFIRSYIDSAQCDKMGLAEDNEFLTDSQLDEVMDLVRNAFVQISFGVDE